MARIILIDDHQTVRTVIRRALESAGHDVLEAGDGAQGLTLLADEQVVCPLADRRGVDIFDRNSEAMNPEARCRAGRPCFGGSESRNRLSELRAWPVDF